MDMKPDTIVVFPNDKEGIEKRPDFTGTALWNGEEIKVALCNTTSKAGNAYMSGGLQKPYNNGSGDKPADVNRSTEGADIPF